MTCLMPNILPLMTTLDQTSLLHVNIYFVMDGIEELRDLGEHQPTLSNFIYNVIPKISKFEEDGFVKQFDLEETDLVIKVYIKYSDFRCFAH